jgi:hypothetical protein
MPNSAAVQARGYRPIMGSDTADDDPRFPPGAHTAYTLELTEDEAARFAAAANCRYVELDMEATPDRAVGRPTGTAHVPTLSTLAHMRARYVDLRRWHGRDVRVAVLDQGTTQPVRDAMGWTLVARTITSGITMPAGGEIYDYDDGNHDHGCMVAPNAVPAGGLLLDAVISGATGGGAFSAQAAGVTWAVDNGAKVINISFSIGESPGLPENYQQVFLDAVIYAAAAGVQIVLSAGNDNQADLNYPSSISRTRSNVFSSIAFDEATDRRGLFSNYHADASGSAAGVDVASFTTHGRPLLWDGTSASSPHMAQLIARGATGGQFTTAQVATALKNNARDSGAGASQQGKGVWDLHRALVALGGEPSTGIEPGIATPTFVNAVGGAGNFASYDLPKNASAQLDDVRVVFLVSSNAAKIVVPPGWVVLTDTGYLGNWEASQGITVGPTRMRVLAKPVTADEPATTAFSFGGATFFSAFGVLTLRVPGGFDPERFAPIVRMGTSGSLTAVPVVPATSNDLLVTAFAHRHPSSSTGTLTTPAGLTTRGTWRTSGTGTGYVLMLATAPLTSAARTAAYTSTSNDTTGTWATVALTVPGSAYVAPENPELPPTAVTLTRRVVGIPSTTAVPISVRTINTGSARIKLGTDEALTTGVVFGTAATPNTNGDVQLTATGLTPGTQYFYRIGITDAGKSEGLDTGTVGRFRTAPSGQANFAFNFGSCSDAADAAVFGTIANRNDDLFFHLGDFYYRDGESTALTNFRTIIANKLTGTNQGRLYSTTPAAFTPSDHDGLSDDSTAGTASTAWANWNAAYRELMPRLALASAGTSGVYYTFTWGRLRFLVLDERSFKSSPSATDNSSKTVLGATQKQWVKDTINAATEQVIVLVQADPWHGSSTSGEDNWLGYITERTEMATFFSGTGKNIVMLAGDMHALAVEDGPSSPGGVPVFHAAPFYQDSSIKGGPYDAGPYPSSASSTIVQQYGRIVVTDTGTQISLAYTGYSSDNTVRVTRTKTYNIP